MSCTICNRFNGGSKIQSFADWSQNKQVAIRNHINHRFTWEEMLVSARSCYSCSILESGCRGCFNLHGIRESDVIYGSLRFFYPSWTEIVDEADTNKSLTFFLKNERQFEVELFATEGDDCPIPDAWEYFPVSRRTSLQTDSTLALVAIKGWISGCITTHVFCDTPEHPYLPIRVVDTGLNNGVVKLVKTNEAKGRYICLSHCWGSSQIITTTRSTFEDRTKGIAWDDLSKTFQDAICLTRTLGFRYIWIDSLCIIQDDARDW